MGFLVAKKNSRGEHNAVHHAVKQNGDGREDHKCRIQIWKEEDCDCNKTKNTCLCIKQVSRYPRFIGALKNRRQISC